jgi:AraC-like DNA-binding protein
MANVSEALIRTNPTGIDNPMTKRTYDISQEFVAACNLLNVDPERVLRNMGLPARNTSGLSLTAKQVALIFGLIVTEYGRDDFHIRLADGFAKAAFGHAFLALQCSETLREGIYRVARFKQLIEPVDWAISESDRSLSVTLRSQSPDFPFGGVSQVMSFLWLVKSCRNITARNIEPTRVSITGEVMHQAEIERDLGCPIELSSEARLDFPLEAMDAFVLSSNRYVVSGLDAGAARVRRDSTKDDSFVTVVHSKVLELLPSGAATSERVARRLALSKRTLERRLSDQGASFTEIVRDCRFRMANHYLRNTQLPIAEISLLLGYREVNSFYRAFKAWYGHTPQEARNDVTVSQAS